MNINRFCTTLLLVLLTITLTSWAEESPRTIRPKFLYSIQLGTFKNPHNAYLFFQNLPLELKTEAFIYETETGYSTVRIWLSPNKYLLKKKIRRLEQAHITNFWIVKTDPQKVSPRKTLLDDRKKHKKLDPELLKLLLTALIGGKDLKTAEKVALRAIHLFPHHPYFWEVLGNIYLWTNRAYLAIQPFEKVYALTKDKKIAEQIFSLALAINRFDIAEKYLYLFEDQMKPKDIVFIYNQTGDIDGLIRYLKKRNDKFSMMTLARIYDIQGNKQLALKVLDRLEKQKKMDINGVLLKANIFYSLKKYQESLAVLKKAISKRQQKM